MSYGGGDKCDRCKQTVYFAEEVRSEGGRYHKSCFVCCSCNKSLDSTTVASHEDDVYCKSCHGRKFGPKGYGYGGGSGVLSMDTGGFPVEARKEPAPSRSNNAPNPSKSAPRFGGADKCGRCGKSVYANEKVIAAGSSWHKRGCFTCSSCGKGLESTTLNDKDGEIYCKGCYGKQFGPKGYGYGGGAGALTRTK